MATIQQQEFQQHCNDDNTATMTTLQPEEQQNNACMICLEESVGYPVQEVASLGEIVQRPQTFPENIWCDRVCFLICFQCFLNLATIGTPPPSTLDSEDNLEENEFMINLDFDTPLTNQDAFWGIWRKHKFNEFLQDLSNMLPRNTSGEVDLNVLGASFWNDRNYWTGLEQQWKDEFSELELTAFNSDIDYSS